MSNDKFEAKVGEIGNYVWWGTKDDLKRVKGFLFANMKTALMVRQMGWNNRGFYVFCNGAYCDGKWQDADEYGVVDLGDKGSYYIPGASSLYKEEKNLYDFERNFVHRSDGVVTLRQITDQIFKVYGANGKIGFLYMLASIFHDIVAETSSPRWFPVLNLFGPIGTGKTGLYDALLAFFTQKGCIDIPNATIASISEMVAASSNALVALNEYKNDVDDRVVEMLKGFFDLIGRSRMNWDSPDKQKVMTAVDSGIILAGQEMPTKDNALFSRTIFLTFSKSQFSVRETEDFNKLTELKEQGLTHLTMDILNLRDKMNTEYKNTFYLVCEKLQAGMSASSHTTRIVKNWAVLLATYKILKDSINVDINEDEITQSIVEGIKRQNLACKTTDELASFWDKLIYLFIQEQTLYVNGHFRVERRKRVKSLSKEERAWDTPHPVLYLRKDGIMEMYQEACKKVGEKFIPKESLEFYLKSAPYFIFESKCRFKAFTKTGIEIPDYSKPVGVGAFKQQEHSLTAYCFDYAWLQEMYDIDLERVPCKDEETDIETSGLFDK